MSNLLRNWVVFPFVAVSAMAAGAATASAQAMVNCYAQITTPYTGSGVGPTGPVEGRSATYGDVSVWVLTRKKGLSEWWPQNGGPVEGGLSAWTAKVTYGAPQQSGQPFDIIAIPVDERTSEGLSGWTVRAAQYKEFPGIPLPTPAKGCRYGMVEVQRVN